MTEQTVKPGEMRLYDEVRPALTNDLYRLSATTTLSRPDLTVGAVDAYFVLEGPRFALPATEVVAVHPPRNALGAFDELLPQVVLGRRTLPWERDLDPDGVIPAAVPDVPDPRPLPGTGVPWLGLLLFVDDPSRREVTVLPEPVPLSSVVTDPAIRARLRLDGADPAVQAIEVDAQLLRRLAPSKDEVRLLSHVRQVNVDDRELAAGDSDGWFAVVMANRLPTPGLRHRACLVSFEQRSDVIQQRTAHVRQADRGVHDVAAALAPVGGHRAGLGVRHQVVVGAGGHPDDPGRLPGADQLLVLLHTWTFTAAPARPGGGSFRELAQALDAGLLGTATPNVTDTGHRALTLRDRTGSDQTVWYRGPLVSRPVPRDPLGPDHSADQARRVSPETVVEDISYAAAFYLGRLLGAADGRLAQDLMAWRREAYRQAARLSVADTVWADVPAIATPPAAAVANGITAPVALTMFERAGAGAGGSADLTMARAVRAAPGLDPHRLAAAWNLTAAAADRLLRDPDAGPPPPAPAPIPALSAASAEDDLQAARRRLLGARPHPDPQEGTS